MANWRSKASVFNSGTSLAEQAINRAYDAYRRVQRKPTDVVLRRNGVKQASQTVRLEYDSGDMQIGIAGEANTHKRELIMFGVIGLPDVTDNDIQVNDQFGVNGDIYTVRDVIYPNNETVGEIQATAYRIE